MATLLKCTRYNCIHCKGKAPVVIPSAYELRELSQEGRMRAFLFAATGDDMWLNYESFDLPPIHNRFIKKEEDE